jgi:hypothetical protein
MQRRNFTTSIVAALLLPMTKIAESAAECPRKHPIVSYHSVQSDTSIMCFESIRHFTDLFGKLPCRFVDKVRFYSVHGLFVCVIDDSLLTTKAGYWKTLHHAFMTHGVYWSGINASDVTDAVTKFKEDRK